MELLTKKDILLWSAVIKLASEGNVEAQRELDAENAVRQKHGLPTIEETVRQNYLMYQ